MGLRIFILLFTVPQQLHNNFNRFNPDLPCYKQEERQISMFLFPGMNAEGIFWAVPQLDFSKSVSETVPFMPFVHMIHLDPVVVVSY